MPLETLQKEGNYFLKPSSCEGCPFYNHGKYYTPDNVVEGSEVFFLAQAPGEQEEAGRKLVKREYTGFSRPQDIYAPTEPGPLLGPTGKLFNDRFLPLTGLSRSQVSLGNALRCRPGISLGMAPNDLPGLTKTMKLETSRADIVKAIRHCTQAHLHIPSSTKLIVTMGRYAMFALTGIQKEDTEYGQKTGVMESWRGYGVDVDNFDTFKTIDTSYYHPFLSSKRIFFTMHLAALFQGERNKRFFNAALCDFNKIRAILNNQWPSEPPGVWSRVIPTTWPKHSSFDTEYDPGDGNRLIRWSMSDTSYNLYCVEGDVYSDYIPVEPGSTILMQNGKVDIPHLKDFVDLSNVKIEDLMLADSVLYTGEPHSLNYIQSKYGSLNRHKHLNADEPEFYSVCDVHQPMYVWVNHYIPEFQRDPLSWKCYKKYTLPLLKIIMKAEAHGTPIDSERLSEAYTILHERVEQYQNEARLLTGNDNFNLGGRKYMMEEIYGVD